jgi:sialidase-1
MFRHYRISLVDVIHVMAVVFSVVTCRGAALGDAYKCVVFKSRDGGYHTYRIPAVVLAGNGDLLAFAEGRKNGPTDDGDIDIVMKRSADLGRSWGPMQLVQDEWNHRSAPVTIGNPVPVVDRLDPNFPGCVWLVFTRNNERVFVVCSDDDGTTWSRAREITAAAKKPSWGWYATGPGHGIQLERGSARGRLIIPCDHRDADNSSWGAHLLYSSDHGASWHLGAVDTREVGSPVHPNESQAVELVGGHIYMNARDQHGTDQATRAITYSSDGGLTFDAPFEAEPTIVTPVVQNSVVRLSAVDFGEGQNVLVYSCPGHSTARRDLTILTSCDESKSWQRENVLHAGPAGYSDLVHLNGSQVGVLYEAGTALYQEIVFAAFGLEGRAVAH